MPTDKPLLITAFRPWGDRARNMTQEVAEALRMELEGKGAEIQILDVLYDAVDDFVKDLDVERYSTILSFGIMRQNFPSIRFETRAVQRDFKPDDKGVTPQFNANARSEYQASAELLALAKHRDLGGYDIGMSDQAGAYLCEYLSYRILEKTNGSDTKAMFVHISNDDKAAKVDFVRDLTALFLE